MIRRVFELLLKSTYDEEKSEELTKIIARRLSLKAKPLTANDRYE
jgi:hypothetical protein